MEPMPKPIEEGDTMADRIVLYGATGYTGKLTARIAAEQGLTPLLAGRNEEKLKAVAEPLGFDYQAVDLGDNAELDSLLAKAAVVLHIAGPFSATSRPMADACLRTGTHYLDITGEMDVFEALASRHKEAQERGVMLLPGVGFDVVPTDCMAAHLKSRLDDANDLRLYIAGLHSASHGTMKTAIEGMGSGTRVRRDGRIVALKSPLRAKVDFGDGEKACIGIGWGDVSTAYYTTGIPNIQVMFRSNSQLESVTKFSRYFGWLLRNSLVQNRMKAAIDRRPAGPTDQQRAKGFTVIVGEARNAAGELVRSRLRTPEGYTLTALTALHIAKRTLEGEAKPGFQTPGGLFGGDFVLGFDGCTREDL
jgi:short subunit dehydrogenase-like uncharacterized protein